MIKDWRSTYHDLCTEIEILELRASDLEFQLKLAKNTILRGGKLPSDGHICIIPLDKAVERYDDVKDELLRVVAVLEHKKQTKQKIEERMKGFEGIEYQVAYMRDILVKPLSEIADELGYSLPWVKKISSRVGKLLTAS